MDNHRITGLNDPQNSTDVVNKQLLKINCPIMLKQMKLFNNGLLIRYG